VQIGAELWEARVRNCFKYKFFLDNILEEIGDSRRVTSNNEMCTPQFREGFKLEAPVPVTTIQVNYSAPPGHTLYLRTEAESRPMVPVSGDIWEARFATPPARVEVTLDGIVAAKEGAFTPKVGKTNKITSTFAFDKVLER